MWSITNHGDIFACNAKLAQIKQAPLVQVYLANYCTWFNIEIMQIQPKAVFSELLHTITIFIKQLVLPLPQGSPTWCPLAPGRPQGTCRSPAGLF